MNTQTGEVRRAVEALAEDSERIQGPVSLERAWDLCNRRGLSGREQLEVLRALRERGALDPEAEIPSEPGPEDYPSVRYPGWTVTAGGALSFRVTVGGTVIELAHISANSLGQWSIRIGDNLGGGTVRHGTATEDLAVSLAEEKLRARLDRIASV